MFCTLHFGRSPQVPAVVLVLCEALDRGHEDVVVAEETLEDEAGEEVLAEAGRVLLRVEDDQLHADVQPLPRRWR